MLIIPYKTDAPERRYPWVNKALIGINILVFLIANPSMRGGSLGGLAQEILGWGTLNTYSLKLHQFVSYQFLHGDAFHILGNMLFLWVFGNAVNAKMGNAAYLLFYLAAGVFAGIGFTATSSGSCIGASGSIAGVTTAFLVLFPDSRITIFYWFWFYVGTIPIRALLLITIKIILWDNIVSMAISGGMSSVAYSAHIAGYLYGFFLCLILLGLRALPRDQYDVLAMLKRYRQRAEYRAAMAGQPEFGTVGAQPANVFRGRPVQAEPVDEEVIALRKEIAEALATGDGDTAVEKYEALVHRDNEQVLSRRNMLDIANRLKTLERIPQAVSAYEKFLKAYPTDSEAPQVRMMLGILFTKYLQQHEAAEQLLRECSEQFSDPAMQERARQWLAAALDALGRGPESEPTVKPT